MSDWMPEDYYFDIELDLEAQEQLNDNIRAEMELHGYFIQDTQPKYFQQSIKKSYQRRKLEKVVK
jgi:hypothetical protein